MSARIAFRGGQTCAVESDDACEGILVVKVVEKKVSWRKNSSPSIDFQGEGN